MHLTNATRMAVGYTLGMDPTGREHLLVVAKGTYGFPLQDEEAQLLPKQLPLVDADTFTGEPGLSATAFESEYALRKPRCDVVLNGSAYAPKGRLARRVRVELRVGSLSKAFDVLGDRTWRSTLLGLRASRPTPFECMPIAYDRAFGGVDDSNPDKVATYVPNPVGVGYHKRRGRKDIHGRPLPNTQHPKEAVKRPSGKYKPMSFGPIGRNFPERVACAGTYDDKWLADGFPFLPPDFDERYYQCAPADQQIPHPQGGETIELVNLTPEGRTAFRIPRVDVPVEFTWATWDREERPAILDTIEIDSDKRIFSLVWRASLPLKKNIFDVQSVVVGRMSPGWYRARKLGKAYYPSIAALVSSRAEEPV